MSYYYLGASLPALSIDSPPEMSVEEFRNLCSQHMTKSDMRVLNDILSGNETESSHPFAAKWTEKKTLIRNAIARTRASRLQIDASDYLKEQTPVSVTTEKKIADAFASANPADREHAIDKYTWTEIEDIAGYDPFSTNAILAYALKLKLAERWAGMTEEDGTERASAIISARPGDTDETQQEQKASLT